MKTTSDEQLNNIIDSLSYDTSSMRKALEELIKNNKGFIVNKRDGYTIENNKIKFIILVDDWYDEENTFLQPIDVNRCIANHVQYVKERLYDYLKYCSSGRIDDIQNSQEVINMYLIFEYKENLK